MTAERLAYAIEEGRYPLVTARATEHLNDPRAVDASYDKLEAILARQQPFALVFDMRGASSTPTRRRRFLDWCERNAEPLTRLLMASAIVARSSIERGFVTAGLSLSRPAPWPMRVFSDPHEAEAWALGQYAERASSKVVS